jgi:hypothetical protein
MPAELFSRFREAARITLVIHQAHGPHACSVFTQLGIRDVLVESARCVRLRIHNRLWRLLGLELELSDSPMEVMRVSVARSAALGTLGVLIRELDLHTPGHGAIFAQELQELGGSDLPVVDLKHEHGRHIPQDLTLITGIQSLSGSGESLARLALNLGAGVPIVSLGTGAGVRDRLGLIRITISPEKELVNLMVPSHDADGLQALLIDEGHLDRPGGGFLYQTPIRFGLMDSLLRVGRQEHAASLEQIIAAIDDLKKGTTWRKRLFDARSAPGHRLPPGVSYREVCFVCPDGDGAAFVQAAMTVGAAGATISRIRALDLADEAGARNMARERGIICIPTDREHSLLAALARVMADNPNPDCLLQSIEAAALFSHHGPGHR